MSVLATDRLHVQSTKTALKIPWNKSQDVKETQLNGRFIARLSSLARQGFLICPLHTYVSFQRLDLMKTECRSNLWIFPHPLRLTWMEDLQFLNQLNVDARSNWPNLMLTRFQNMKKSMKRNSLTSNTLQRCIATINRWTDYCNNREIIVVIIGCLKNIAK